MSIKLRLMLLVVASLVTTLIVGFSGLRGLQVSDRSISEINDTRLPSLVGLQILNEAQTNIRLRTIETAIWELDYQATAWFADTVKRKAQAWQTAQKGWDIYAPLPQTAEEASLWQRFEQDWAAWKAVDTRLTQEMEKLAQPHSEQAQKDIFATFYKLYEQQRELFNQSESKLAQLISMNMQLAKQEGNQAHATSSNSQTVMTLVVILGIMVLAGLAWWVIANITRAIANVVSQVSHIASVQNFNTSLPSTKDEFNELNQSINRLVSGLNQALEEANHVVGAIAKADFSQRVSGNYVGDLAVLKQGINASAASVSFMIGELEKVMNGLNEGNFATKMDPQVPKAFRELVETALYNINHIITDINQIMTRMAEGDFSGQVTATASGELLLMKTNINSSMKSMSSAINSISAVVGAQAQGDLTKELPSRVFKGQLHELKNALNYANQKVKSSVIQAISASNVVSDAAAQVSQGSANLSGRVQEQAAALEETSATMNEMAAAVQANTANAQKVAELAHQVQDQATEGAEVMQKTIVAMQSIQESSRKIADIVSLIDGIAFQTNLLALNAAVEAARAGEQGRGFAVVAGEVRALAQKSATAAKDIKHLINDSVSRIEVGTQLADRSGDMLSAINRSVIQVAQMIESIAHASSEQSEGINQVHKAMNNIDRVTQENAALVEETTTAAESLSTEAIHLKENMGFFNTGR